MDLIFNSSPFPIYCENALSFFGQTLTRFQKEQDSLKVIILSYFPFVIKKNVASWNVFLV